MLGGWVEGQYLAVFVDGRILPIGGARLLDERKIRLELPNGGGIVVPVTRVDRIVEAAVEPDPQPVVAPLPACGFAYVEAEPPAGTPFAGEIVAAAKAANLHPGLVVAVVQAESAFQPYAISRVGAAGLMQLMPSVWLGAGLQTPFEPASNLRAGSTHLRALLERFKGDLTLALAAYNAGAAAVEKYGGVPPYAETRGYVRRVLGRFCPELQARPTSGPEEPLAAGG
ncbi:MAG: lytic transglycosylase domain-containing protein [Thermoanaerobaculaceae bacterium]|jgi:hypothetical protein|nr:lytic transglycosylase domain-containing protein [Thermoanaerobaculaceae bacterium]